MGAFRTVIGCNMDQFKTGSTDPTRYLILDTQEDKQVSGSATIATQPLQDGDTMSDHMYRDPVTVSISGSFSLNGKNWNDDSYDFMQKGDRLTNIQEVFEYILNNGILCTLTTIDEDGFTGNAIQSGAKNRFKIRRNMALKHYTWTERQNSVKFSFEFQEVLMVERQEYEITDIDLDLPNVMYPVGSSLGTILKDTNKLPEIIISALQKGGYIDDDFLRDVVETNLKILGTVVGAATITVAIAAGVLAGVSGTVAGITAIATAAGISGTALTTITGAATTALAAGPVGVIIVAAIAVIAAIGFAIWAIINAKQQREAAEEKRRKTFKLIDGSSTQDALRLRQLIDDIEAKINKIKSNLTIYTINGNYEQQDIINIAGDYYQINFLKNSISHKWYADVLDLEGNTLADLVYRSWCPVSKFTDLNRTQNLWFVDKTKQCEVYLVNPSLNEEVNDTQSKVEAAEDNLESYSIWVSKGNIENEVNKVLDAIDNAIQEEGFI